MTETPRTRADIECELSCLRYEVKRATQELDRAGVEKYDNRVRSDSTDDSEGSEWSIQKRIALLARGSRSAPVDAERERMLDLLREIAGSGVSFEDSRIKYVEVQIDRGDWEELQAFVGRLSGGEGA